MLRALSMLALVGLAACGLAGNTAIPTVEVEQGDFQVVLSVAGELDAVKNETITAPAFRSRPEIAWIIEEGTRVEEGDRILAFDIEAMEKELAAAKNELLLAQTKIEQNQAKLRLKISDANADIQRAELDLEVARMQRTDSETVPLVDRENARVNEVKAELSIESSKSALATTKLESEAETQLLKLEVEERTRQVEELEKQLDKAVITAPTDGLVLIETDWQGKWKVGSRPWTGATLMKVPDLSKMKVVALVHEVDSPDIEVGQPATVVIDAYPDQEFGGKVSKVADLAVARGEDQVKYLEFEVELDESTPEMKPGMTVRVDLLLDQVEDVVWVPIEAVQRDGDYARVWTKGLTGWSETEVELGAENDTHVVVEGVGAGSRVALVDPEVWESDEGRPAAEDESAASAE